METKRIIYDFCPKCGGLTKDGVCTACGSVWDGKETETKQPEALPSPKAELEAAPFSDLPMENCAPTEKNLKKNTAMAFLLVGVGMAAVLLLLALVIPPVVRLISPKQETQETEEDVYRPDPGDEYYVQLSNALRYDLSYQVEWQEEVQRNGEGSSYFSAEYPQLTGEMPHLEQINALLKEKALSYEKECEAFEGKTQEDYFYIYVFPYVTRMEEDYISVAFDNRLCSDGVERPVLTDITLDLTTGRQLAHTDMIRYTKELAEFFRSQNRKQNTNSLEQAGWTEETFLQLLESEDGVAFFTPVGLEIGFNYDAPEIDAAGWVTVTAKEYAQYVKMP